MADYMEHLPEEIHFTLVHYLTARDILSLRLVSQRWRDDPSIIWWLQRFHTPLNLKTTREVQYFTWLMRTSPGIPFSKFKFHFENSFSLDSIEEFTKSCGERILELCIFNSMSYCFQITTNARQQEIGYSGLLEYGQILTTLILNAPFLTSLTLNLLHDFKIPTFGPEIYRTAFRNLKHLKVRFRIPFPAYKHDEFALVDAILCHCSPLEVLSLVYDPCSINITGNLERLRSLRSLKSEVVVALPKWLRLHPFAKIELRLGIIFCDFLPVVEAFPEIQPWLVSFSFHSLSCRLRDTNVELYEKLRSLLWKLIRFQPNLKKIKCLDNSWQFWKSIVEGQAETSFPSVQQLQFHHVENAMDANLHGLFPNLRKFATGFVRYIDSPPDYCVFKEFIYFTTRLPYLKHFKLIGSCGTEWEVITGEQDNSIPNPEEIFEFSPAVQHNSSPSPLKALKALEHLEIELELDPYWEGHSLGFLAIFYASTRGKIQRFKKLTLGIKYNYKRTREHEGVVYHVEYPGSHPAKILSQFHDNLYFINCYNPQGWH